MVLNYYLNMIYMYSSALSEVWFNNKTSFDVKKKTNITCFITIHNPFTTRKTYEKCT